MKKFDKVYSYCMNEDSKDIVLENLTEDELSGLAHFMVEMRRIEFYQQDYVSYYKIMHDGEKSYDEKILTKIMTLENNPKYQQDVDELYELLATLVPFIHNDYVHQRLFAVPREVAKDKFYRLYCHLLYEIGYDGNLFAINPKDVEELFLQVIRKLGENYSQRLDITEKDEFDMFHQLQKHFPEMLNDKFNDLVYEDGHVQSSGVISKYGLYDTVMIHDGKECVGIAYRSDFLEPNISYHDILTHQNIKKTNKMKFYGMVNHYVTKAGMNQDEYTRDDILRLIKKMNTKTK